ncbi:hypothetical protein LK994_13050 [Ferruginibacter lapsinanis]|uniref:beta strand repeat-containing protein n=1 Tax=Ferruginibacter lapsinanis TaxID=563172 RepID=UPI001E57977C|nr:hypothetical protein [Ferruginibacter lapsinanis]UEG49562.1 hypothetical protein LK994_13050 [Ferruginibacter lapsinanis]
MNLYNTSVTTFVLAASNTASIAGILDIGNQGGGASVFTVNGTATVTATGTYRHGTTSGTIPTMTWNTGSTCEITGAVSTAITTGVTQSFSNFTWNSSGQTSSLNFSGGLTTVNGTFTCQNTGTGSLRFTGNTALTMNVGAFVVSGGNMIFTTGTSASVYNFGSYSQSGGTVTVTNNTTAVNVQVNVSGDYSLSGGGTFNLNSGVSSGYSTLSLGGNFSVSSTGSLQSTGGAMAYIKFVKSSGAQTFTTTAAGINTNPIIYTVGTGSSTNTVQLLSNVPLGNSSDFTVSAGATLDAQTFIISGTSANFYLPTGSSIITANTNSTGALTTTATGAFGTIQVTGTRTYSTGANYTFNGASAQVTGNGFTGANNLIINNSAGVTQTSLASVSGTLTFTAGKLINTALGGAGITITGSVSGASSSRYIQGFETINKTTTTATFDIGDANGYEPIVVNFSSQALNVTASTTSGDHADVTAGNTNFAASNTANRTWTLTGTAVTGGFTSGTFTYLSGDLDVSATPTTFSVGDKAGGTWTYNSGSATSTSASFSGAAFALGVFQVGQRTPPPNYIVHQSSNTAVTNDCSGSTAKYWNQTTPAIGSPLIVDWNIELSGQYTNTGIYYTTDGTTPGGTRGVASGTSTFVAFSSVVCTDGSNKQIITGTIPASANTGVLVKYIIGAWNGNTGTEGFATTTYTFQNTIPAVYSYTPTCGTPGTWIGGTTGDWNNAANWCGGIPTSASNISVPNGVTISIATANASANSITTTGTGGIVISGAYTLSISNGGSITNNGSFSSTNCNGTVNFLGTGTISGTAVPTFPNLSLIGTVVLNTNINIIGNFTTGTQQTNNGKSITFNGTCGNQLITRTGGGTEYFSAMIIDKTTGNLVLSNSPATNVSIDDPAPATNIGVTTLTIKNAGKLDINGQIFTMNGGAGGTGSANARAAILVDGASGGETKTILSTIADGTFNLRGTFRGGVAGVEVNTINGGKLLFDNYVSVNTNIGFAPTDITTIGYKLELLGVAAYNGGFIADVNSTNSANGHCVYGVGSTLIYNNHSASAFDRNRDWDAVGVQTAGTTPGYPYNVTIKGNSTLNIANGSIASGITSDRAIANDLTIEAGSTLDMNVMDQTGNHLTIGRDIIIAGALKLGHGTTSNNPFVGDILVGRNWTRTGKTSIFDPNETGAGFTAANTQTVISDITSNIKARAVTFFGTDASTIKAPRNITRDINGAFGGETFPYLKLDKTNTTNTLTNDTSTIVITRELFLTKGTLSLGDSNIVIVSNLYRTADVAPIATPANVVINYNYNGRFVAQRFIYNQSTQRSWRFLTAPLQASDPLTINDAWQEGVSNPVKTNPQLYNPWPSKAGTWCGLTSWPGFGTQITKNSGTYDEASGFDDGTSGASIKWYDNTGNTTVWGYPSDTKSTRLMSKPAWSLFVRGDRGFVIGNQYVPASTTILEPRGKINIGDVTTTVLSGKNNLIGNPYACQINMTNVNVGGVTKKNFKLWDPKAFSSYSSTGKYIPFTWISGTTYTTSNSPVTTWTNPGTVESGEAFLADNLGSSSVVFHESDKVSGVSSLDGIQSRPIRNNRPMGDIVSFFRVNLAFYNTAESGYTSIDGTLNLYNASYNTSVDKEEDVVSPIGSSTGAIRIAKDGFQLAISKEATISNVDTIFLALSSLQKVSHELILTTTDFVPDVEATLIDRYLNTNTPIMIGNTDTTFYSFDITTDAQSNRSDRFMIVLKPSTTLPVRFTNVKASMQSGKALVEWKVENEINISQYQIEKSSDGQIFSPVQTVTPDVLQNGRYSFLDNEVLLNKINYYRIISINQAGAKAYSSVVKVRAGGEALISLVANPLNNGEIEVAFKNVPKGEYKFRLFNMQGQELLSEQITVVADDYISNMIIGRIDHRGTYQLEIINPDHSKSNIKVIY